MSDNSTPKPDSALSARIDALLADAEAGGALAVQAARQAAALSASQDPDRYRQALALAARLDPLDSSPRLALARRLAEEGALDDARLEAAHVFNEAVDASSRAHGAFILGEIARASGAFEDARARFEAALQIETALLKADPKDPVAAQWYARAAGRLAELNAAAGAVGKARTGAGAALGMLQALTALNRETPMLAADIADAEMRCGVFDLDSSDAAGAGTHFTQAIARYEALILIEPDEPHWRAVLADCWSLAAEAAFARNAPAPARAAIDRALQLRIKLALQDPAERGALAGLWRVRAALLAALGDARPASESLIQAVALAQQLCADAPGASAPARFLLHTYLEQADLALGAALLEEARTAASAARIVAEPFAQAKDSDPIWRADLAAAWDRLGAVARAGRALGPAQDAFARAVELRRLAHGAAPDAPGAARGLAASLIRAGECALDAGDLQSARASFGEGLRLRLSLSEAAPLARAPARDLAIALERIGVAAAALGDGAAARAAWEEELALAKRLYPDEYDWEGLRFRAVIEAHLAALGGAQAESHRAAALARFDTLAREGKLSAREETLRQKLWRP